jgi:hypothetical protein
MYYVHMWISLRVYLFSVYLTTSPVAHTTQRPNARMTGKDKKGNDRGQI